MLNRRMLFPILLVLLLCCPWLPAQGRNTKKEAEKSQTTFKVPVNVIVVNVTVADREGNPVTDLTSSDFKLFDDGKPQTIQTFALESYGPARTADSQNRATAPAPAAEVPAAMRPRMISLLIDDLTSRSIDYYPRIIKALTDFVEKDITLSDQVAILSGSGRVRYPFSDDKQTLLEEISGLLGKLNFDAVARSECPELTDLQARRIGDPQIQGTESTDLSFRVAVLEAIDCLALDPEDQKSYDLAKNHALMVASRQTEESDYRTRGLLDTLRQHLRSLRHFEATKSVVLFSDGFLSEGGSMISYQLQEVVDMALRSGVILHSVDVRGLYTDTPPASVHFSAGVEATRYKPSLYLEDMRAQEDPLAQISNETGGLFFHNNNDLYRGLQNILRRQAVYYVLTYAMPSQKADGRYRRIRLEVSRPGLEVSYRKGYYAPKEEMTFERRKKEDILEALRAPGNLNEIPINLAYNYYQEDDSRYGVSFLTNISIRGLSFLDEEARRKNLISMVLVAFDENDRYIDGVEKSIDLRLLETSYAMLLDQGLTSRVELRLPFGRYKIKAVVRESTQGKMGSIAKAIEIP